MGAWTYITYFAEDLSDLKANLEVLKIKSPLNIVRDNTLSPGFQKQLVFTSNIDLKIVEYGRGIVSNYEIQPGELLFIEPAYASIVLEGPEDVFICNHCYKTDIYPVPCNFCTGSIYCTKNCKVEAWNKYHEWECFGTQNGFWKEFGIAHLATRIVIINSSNFNDILSVTRNRSKMDVDAEIIWKDLCTFHKTQMTRANLKENVEHNYAFVFSLLTHIESLDKQDAIKYCLTAILITSYLRCKTKLFDHIILTSKDVSMDIQQWFILLSALILHHICQLICNAHTINGYKEALTSHDDEYFYEVATALYPVISMMNHSCDPNIVTSFSGSTQMVKARRAIKKGEEIFNCYGPHYRRMAYDVRQSILCDQYHFTCKCSACDNPDYCNLSETFFAYNCSDCNSPIKMLQDESICEKCGIVNIDGIIDKLTDSQKKIKNFSDIIKNKTKAFAKETLLDICINHERYLYKNNSKLSTLYGWIASTFAGLDLFEDSLKYAKEYLSKTELVYGVNSLETADCYSTYAEILIKYLEVLKTYDPEFSERYQDINANTRQNIQKALFIYNLHFAEETMKLKNLQLKLSALDAPL